MSEIHLGFAVHEIILDEDGKPVDYRFLAVNPGFEKITGLKEADIKGKTVRDVLPEIEDHWIDAYGSVALTGEPVRFENYSRELDRYFEVHAYRSAPNQFVTVFTDATDRRQAEVELQRNEWLLLATQRLAKIGGWELDLENSVTFWTDQVYRIHDMNPGDFSSIDEAIQLSLECYHPDDRAAVMESFKKCVELGQPYDQEFPFTTTKGRKIWIRTIASPVVENGKIVKVVGYLMDISDQKRGEQEKLLLERQVQHAQKLESLGVLAGGIAHDFNNLLMGIMGNADLALHIVSSDDPARMHLLEIDKAALRAADLAKQMLAYSGRGRFLVEQVNLNALVEETGHLLEVSISKKATLKFDLADELPDFRGDPTQIGQVVMNLITNASEAIGDIGGDIVLTTGTETCDREYLDSVNDVLLASLDEPLKEGRYVYMQVTDTGGGMDAVTKEKIFDPFFTTKFTGRGLGMSSVLGIICGHKGAIEIETEAGKGTTFRVLFPVSDAEDAAPESEKRTVEPTVWKGTGTVLIVDDEDSVRAVAKGMLGVLGFDTLEAPDGRRALEMFRENVETIACVLLDFKMPHMDGVETFREMHRISPTVKAILCSGFNETDTTDQLDEGIAGFLQKPYRMAVLKEKIKDVLA